jgi:hypothetical protein
MWTAHRAYVIQFLGMPYIYNYVELADNCTPWSPASMSTTSSYILWMSQQGMFSFDGTTIMPVACLVRSWITDDIDIVNVRSQAFAFHNSLFSEFWWFYPQNGQPYNTRCVFYNYKEGWWSQGTMSRSGGITSTYTAQPILADGLMAFEHEIGSVYNNAALPWAETFDLNLNSGGKLTTFKQLIPNVEGDITNLQFSFWYRKSRSISVPAPPAPVVDGLWTPPAPIRPNGYVDVRITGRDIRMRLSTINAIINSFTVGRHLVDVVPRGDR